MPAKHRIAAIKVSEEARAEFVDMTIEFIEAQLAQIKISEIEGEKVRGHGAPLLRVNAPLQLC